MRDIGSCDSAIDLRRVYSGLRAASSASHAGSFAGGGATAADPDADAVAEGTDDALGAYDALAAVGCVGVGALSPHAAAAIVAKPKAKRRFMAKGFSHAPACRTSAPVLIGRPMKKGLLALFFASAEIAAAVMGGCGDNGVSGGDAGPDTTQADVKPTVDAAKDAPFDAAKTDAPPFQWPDCTSQPQGVPSKTIPDLWSDDPTTPTQVWLPGVYVTAISKGACTAGTACEFIVQQDLTYASLEAGAQHAIRAWITSSTAKYFTSLAVGDQVNALAWAFRESEGGQNELILHVDQVEPGCALKIGSGTPTPITGVALSDVDSLAAYEQIYGPLLMQIANVTGTPKQPDQTFGLGDTFYDGGANDGQIVSLSPYYMDGGAFVGLEAGVKTKFASVSGVFNEYFNPDASAVKYLELGPRASTDYP